MDLLLIALGVILLTLGSGIRSISLTVAGGGLIALGVGLTLTSPRVPDRRRKR